MNNKEIMELTARHVANTYGRFPVAMVRGAGSRLWDADGREYLDFTAGLAVCNLGHCHPAIVTAIKEQAEKLLHVSNLYHIETQSVLASMLTANSFADKAFFCNSGAEANEAAMKLVRKYFHSRSSARYQVITMEKSFHGRTFGALAATGQKKYQEGFEPLLEKFTYVPFNDAGAVARAINSSTAAVMLEPVQGEGGVNVPSDGYFKEVKDVCTRAGVLLVFDEVQSGMGRTGKLFAHEHFGVTPDVMTLAKGLAGGVAIGAMLATDEVASAFTPGSHASTFGGNPLATAAAIATMRVLLEPGTLEGCRASGEYLMARLDALRSEHPFIKEVRGKGLIIGAELDERIDGSDIVKKCMDNGLLINCIGGRTLRFIPPITIDTGEVDRMFAILKSVLDTCK